MIIFASLFLGIAFYGLENMALRVQNPFGWDEEGALVVLLGGRARCVRRSIRRARGKMRGRGCRCVKAHMYINHRHEMVRATQTTTWRRLASRSTSTGKRYVHKCLYICVCV